MFDKNVDFDTNFEYSLLELGVNYTDYSHDNEKIIFNVGLCNFNLTLKLEADIVRKVYIDVNDTSIDILKSTYIDLNIDLNIDFNRNIIKRVIYNKEDYILNDSKTINSIVNTILDIKDDLYKNKNVIFTENRQGLLASRLAHKLDCKYVRTFWSNSDSNNSSIYSNLILMNKTLDDVNTIGVHLYQENCISDVNVIILKFNKSNIEKIDLGKIKDELFFFGNLEFLYDSKLFKLLLFAFNDYINNEENRV